MLILILYWGQALFIPLSVALLISFILYPFCTWLEGFKIARVLAIFIGLMLVLLLITIILWLLANQFSRFMQERPAIKDKLSLIQQLDLSISNSWISIFIDMEAGLLGSFIEYMKSQVLPTIPKTIYESSISFVLFILILMLWLKVIGNTNMEVNKKISPLLQRFLLPK
ncbi:MAG: putative PurR-regulated permease PerM [Marivirga sp.]